MCIILLIIKSVHLLQRAKKVFDPSDNNLPTRTKKRGPGRPLGSLNKATVANNVSPHVPLSATSPQSAKTTNATTSPQRVNTGTQVKPYTKICDSTSTPNPSLCHICHSYGTRVKGVPERLVSCTECATRGKKLCSAITYCRLELSQRIWNLCTYW